MSYPQPLRKSAHELIMTHSKARYLVVFQGNRRLKTMAGHDHSLSARDQLARSLGAKAQRERVKVEPQEPGLLARAVVSIKELFFGSRGAR